ncbi:MAG TPA: LLM class flavin-dependent oxidoreductase [Ktedonosporobacter sp.]|jgi:alkanesulfonate monooxygenase/4-(gamma-L-glutamylamino)butanoyl-[BtrI acyl-carrier protein] monooxygenase|nr:LLM class flavin-dependent oxidoreductase [Ktedonosporobacter sp.]
MSYPFRLYGLIPGIDRFRYTYRDEYLKAVIEMARLADEYHYTGSLIHYNHQVITPWILASTIIQQTAHHIPLIALQPASMPPLTVAKMIESFAYLFGRPVSLNIVAGAARTELEAIGDTVGHDERYERMREYIEIIRFLCMGENVTYRGKYYTVKDLRLKPGIAADMLPRIFIAGSSPAGIQVALDVADVVVTHPQPTDLFKQHQVDQIKTARVSIGIRLGIIARPSAEAAWTEAWQRFPPSRKGRIRTMMQKNSESQWTKDLAHLASEREVYDEVFWLGAYHSGNANCPYLVGSYDQVAAYLGRYLALGTQDILVDGPLTREEFDHTDKVFQKIGTPSVNGSDAPRS